jgi:hypothetical protein
MRHTIAMAPSQSHPISIPAAPSSSVLSPWLRLGIGTPWSHSIVSIAKDGSMWICLAQNPHFSLTLLNLSFFFPLTVASPPDPNLHQPYEGKLKRKSEERIRISPSGENLVKKWARVSGDTECRPTRLNFREHETVDL